MKDDLFNTEQKRKDAIASLTSLMSHDGWVLIQKILDKNIEVLQMQLESGVEDEKKSDIDRIRDKLKLTREFRSTPEDTIYKLETPETEPENPDPFDTEEDVAERKGEEVDTEEETL